MKRTLFVTLFASMLVVPMVSFAQSSSTITRAQVKAELKALRDVGYYGDTQSGYPAEILAAEQRLASKSGQSPSSSGVGSDAKGSSASGSRTDSVSKEIPGL
jgi:hypothetical protein